MTMLSEDTVTEQRSSEKRSAKMTVGSSKYQSALLILICLLDVSIVLHMIFVNLGSRRMYFIYGVKFYVSYPNRPWTLVHAGIGVIPLMLSLYQISSVARLKSLRVHRILGFLLVACGGLQIPATVYLGVTWTKREVTDVMRAMFAGFAFLWGLWGFAVLYYIRWKRDIELHRQWAVRFSVICHYVPIFGRILAVAVWYLCGQPLDDTGRAAALQKGIWTLAVLFVPFQEFFVWLECGTCWLQRHPNAADHSTIRKEEIDESTPLMLETLS